MKKKKGNRVQEIPEKQVVSEWPLLVDLELVSKCNLKCPMCPTITYEFLEKRVTPFKKGLMEQRLLFFCEKRSRSNGQAKSLLEKTSPIGVVHFMIIWTSLVSPNS